MSATHKLYRFGTFELNLGTEELRKAGTLIKLSPQPLQLLALLASRAGQIVTREEIQEALWGGDTFVDFEQGMNHCIRQIRTALNDNAAQPLYIETIPRRGYRFLAPVVFKNAPVPAPRVEESKSGIMLVSSSVLPQPKATSMPGENVGPPPGRRSSDAGLATATAAVAEPAPLPMPVKGDQPNPPNPGRRWAMLAAAVVLVTAVIVTGYRWWLRRSMLLNEKDTIVVADFANSTGEAVFDGTLKQALAFELEQSPFLNVLSDEKVFGALRLMDHPAGDRLTQETAREVCLRTNSKAMLAGSIAAVGEQYLVTVRALGCRTGDTLASAKAEAPSKNQVLKALDNVSKQLREKLGESLPSLQKFNQPLQDVTTSSLEALQAYTQGRSIQALKGDAEALPYYRFSVELDPNFARAYASLGTVYSNLNQTALAAENLANAYRLRERASEKEKAHIIARYHDLVTGDINQAIAAHRLLSENYPRDLMAYVDLSYDYDTLGDYDEALAAAEKARQIDSNNKFSYWSPAAAYINLNRFDEAGAVLEEARAQKLDTQELLPDYYLLAFFRGDAAEMARQLAAAAGKPGAEDQLLALQSDTEAYFGRLQKAREFSKAAIASALHADAKEPAALWQLDSALHEAEIGDPQLARQQALQAMATAPSKSVTVLAALALARSGDRQRAQKLTDELAKQYPADTVINDYWIPTVRAAIALDEGNPDGALQALQPVARYELGTTAPIAPLYPIYLRGMAYLKLSRGAEAAVEFQKMLDHRGVIANFPTAALARLQLARAQVLRGDKEAAHKSYQEFLSLWKDADVSLPTLQAAKAEAASLQ